MTQPGGPLESPAARLVRAALRPEFATGMAREAVGAAVTAGLWPLGLAARMTHDAGRADGPEGAHRTPVLLLHGYGANSSYWLFLGRALHAAGFGAVHAFHYQPVRHDVPAAAALCVAKARELMARSGTDRIHLIGHSAGGIVIRHAVQIDGLSEASTVVTVAAPHRGTILARAAVGATARQLRPGSELLTAIADAPAPPATRFVSYYSNMDVVVPGHAARIIEPHLAPVNHLVRDVGHLSILLAPDFHRSVVEELLIAEGRLLRFVGAGGAVAKASRPARLTKRSDQPRR